MSARKRSTDSDAPIGRVAEIVGYHHGRNFASAFRRECGMEPSAYQALHRLRR